MSFSFGLFCVISDQSRPRVSPVYSPPLNQVVQSVTRTFGFSPLTLDVLEEEPKV